MLNSKHNSYWKRLIDLAPPILLGGLACLCLSGVGVINPFNLSWIAGGDPIQHYLGWAFFNQSEWLFPLGLNPGFGMQVSSSIIYSDSIPLLAIFFKLFAPIISGQYQYFGLWLLVCFVLQILFAYKLLSLFSDSKPYSLLGSVFFVLLPIFLIRIGLHAALVGQFLVLAGLYLCLRKSTVHQTFYWTTLLCISSMVQFYLLAMVSALWIADLSDKTISQQSLSFRQTCRNFLIPLFPLLLISWVSGYFVVTGSSISAGDYAFGAMNALSFFDPAGWSFFLRPIPNALRSLEGLHYLGLGLILCLGLALYVWITGKVQIKSNLLQHRFLLLNCLLLSIFALSNKIAIGPLEFTFSPPQVLMFAAGILRSSGRMAWPLIFLLIFVSLFLIYKGFNKKTSLLIVLCALFIQLVDISPGWLPMARQLHDSSGKPNVLEREFAQFDTPFWKQAAQHYSSVVRLPFQNLAHGWERFAIYALHHRMETNSIYLARLDRNKVAISNQELENSVLSGKYNLSWLYIVDPEMLLPVALHLDDSKDLLARINGINVLAPGWKICSTCPQEVRAFEIKPIIPKTSKNQAIDFSAKGEGRHFLVGIGASQIVGWGWAYPEAFGVWSEGDKAKLTIPLPPEPVKHLELQMRALISPNYPRQIVEVWVNNQLQKKVVLSQDQGNQIFIDLPQADANSAISHLDYVTIELKLPSKATPKDLGLGDDIRELAVGLVSGVWH